MYNNVHHGLFRRAGNSIYLNFRRQKANVRIWRWQCFERIWNNYFSCDLTESMRQHCIGKLTFAHLNYDCYILHLGKHKMEHTKKISKLNGGLKWNRGGVEKFSKFPQCWWRSHHSILLGMKILKKCTLIPYTTFRHKRIVLTSLSYFARYTLHKKCRNPLWKTLFFFCSGSMNDLYV